MSAKISLLIFFAAVLALGFVTRKPAGALRMDHDFSNTLKGIAMFLVLYHHTGIYHSEELWYFFLSGWGFCGVSIFLFISGYGLMKSHMAKEYSYKAYFLRRFTAIWPGIVLCMIARWFLGPFMTISWSPTVNPLYLLGFYEWYILAITFWYAAFIVIVKQTRSIREMYLVCFLVSICLWAILDLLSGWTDKAALWGRFPFSFAMGVFLAGSGDRLLDFLDSRLLPITLILLVAFGLSIHGPNVSVLLDLITPALGLCAAVWIYRTGFNSRLLTWMGKCSLFLYLLQVPLIKYGVFLVQWRRDALGILLTWSIVFSLSAVLHWMDRRIGVAIRPAVAV